MTVVLLMSDATGTWGRNREYIFRINHLTIINRLVVRDTYTHIYGRVRRCQRKIAIILIQFACILYIPN